ncbi:hypothetical protein Cch01nite_18740 [Cellulomonas chitinilytica]|uniref:IrrE N-terminal-like domain-containing protein n=1 Tax=Cellulomonas chitinilytica TaxID=398759 RepID=A0A919P2Q5_9CELL|nr:hypothetical protein [Cellulomonas chitinilytica]GIG21150.1 hypothetical protein Cch01nite_18740 [Cellulomonas chitinilytica]
MAANLRRRAEAALSALGLTGPITNEQIKGILEHDRGRPIVVRTAPAKVFTNAACGAWLEAETIDVILVPDDADPMLQAHTVRHEYGHMILRHQGGASSIVGAETLRELVRLTMPDLDPERVVAMLGRASFTGPSERDAEMIASLLTLRSVRAADVLENAETESLRRALGGSGV